MYCQAFKSTFTPQSFATMKFLHIALFVLLCLTFACKKDIATMKADISVDAKDIAQGEAIFNTNCSGCHNFKNDAIGPILAGLTNKVQTKWIKDFISNPKKAIESKDIRADSLYKKYMVVMAPYAFLGDTAIDKIIAYLNTKNDSERIEPSKIGLKDPIPQPIMEAAFALEIEDFMQFPVSSTNGEMPLTKITKMGVKPGSNDLFVVDLRGKLFQIGGKKLDVFLDMALAFPNFIDKPGLATGFGSFAFHPDFAQNGLFYTTHSEKPESGKADFTVPKDAKITLQWVLTEWKIKGFNAKPKKENSRELMRIDYVSQIHGMQEIAFNPNSLPGNDDYGLLYICSGDGGAVEKGYPDAAGNTGSIYGTVIRIDPSGNNGSNHKYGIPISNPFVKNADVNTLKELYAIGFRNPHRITWTAANQCIVVNVGHNNIESLYKISGGENCGWPFREGPFIISADNLSQVFPLKNKLDSTSYHLPFARYDHDEGKAISGGLECTNKATPELMGKFFFGDIPTGRLFYIETKEIETSNPAEIKSVDVIYAGIKTNLRDLCKNDRVDVHFGKDAMGTLYIMTKADGKIYMIKGLVKAK